MPVTPTSKPVSEPNLSIVLIVIILLAIGAYVLLRFFGGANTGGSSRFTLPAPFVQISATHEKGSIDVAPAWKYTYAITGTRATAYAAVEKALKDSGYTIDDMGASNRINVASGYLTARNPARHVFVAVMILPGPDPSLRLPEVNLNEPVNEVFVDAQAY